MTEIVVDTASKRLICNGISMACSIGRSGAIAADAKREGDGATPLGRYALRTVLLRPDRVAAPATALPWRWLRADDGWSDDPADPAYNRPVTHPHRWSAERLWRDDGVYDVVVVLGYNDAPVLPGLGSAIFLHCIADDGRPTEGCVAVARHQLLEILPLLTCTSAIRIG